MIAVIPAEAGIQKHEQFFVTLHNTSWVGDYCASSPIASSACSRSSSSVK